MKIIIDDKDVLFVAANLIGFLYTLSFLFLDFVATLAQAMARNPDYSQIEVAVFIMRSFGGIAFMAGMLVVLVVDVFWVFRCIRCWQKGYWRENL